MKGTTQAVSGKVPPMAQSHTVMSAKSLRGQGATCGSTKTSSAGGFIASRKKGSVKGC